MQGRRDRRVRRFLPVPQVLRASQGGAEHRGQPDHKAGRAKKALVPVSWDLERCAESTLRYGGETFNSV